MKLTHPIFSAPICFRENRIQVLVVENPTVFRELVTDLVQQSESREGLFVLSCNDTPLDCTGHLNVILDYIHLHELEKKVQTKAIASLLHSTREALARDTFQLSQAIQAYLGKLATLAEFPVAYEEGENLSALLKAMDFHIDLIGIPPCEALYEHMALINAVAKDQCFVLVNARAYFSADELQKLYQMVHYRKLNLLLLESQAHPALPSEEVRLYDGDLCELRLDKPSDLL